MPEKLRRLDFLKIGAAASVDPRTVEKMLAGGRVIPAVEAAVRKAMKDLGYGPAQTSSGAT